MAVNDDVSGYSPCTFHQLTQLVNNVIVVRVRIVVENRTSEFYVKDQSIKTIMFCCQTVGRSARYIYVGSKCYMSTMNINKTQHTHSIHSLASVTHNYLYTAALYC